MFFSVFTRDAIAADDEDDAGDVERNSVSRKTCSFTKVLVVTADSLLIRSTFISGVLFGLSFRCFEATSLLNLRKLKSSFKKENKNKEEIFFVVSYFENFFFHSF